MGGTELVSQEGVDDHAGHRTVVHLDADGHREPGMPVDEVGGPVNGVYQPADARCADHPGALLGQDGIVGSRVEDPGHDALLGPTVDLGDKVGDRRLGGRDVHAPGSPP